MSFGRKLLKFQVLKYFYLSELFHNRLNTFHVTFYFFDKNSLWNFSSISPLVGQAVLPFTIHSNQALHFLAPPFFWLPPGTLQIPASLNFRPRPPMPTTVTRHTHICLSLYSALHPILGVWCVLTDFVLRPNNCLNQFCLFFFFFCRELTPEYHQCSDFQVSRFFPH